MNPYQKLQARKEQRRSSPETLFISQRYGQDDKLQFYTDNFTKWLETMKGEQEPVETITYKFKTEDMGTVMLYNDGECVVHGTDKERYKFRDFFTGHNLQ